MCIAMFCMARIRIRFLFRSFYMFRCFEDAVSLQDGVACVKLSCLLEHLVFQPKREVEKIKFLKFYDRSSESTTYRVMCDLPVSL